MKRIAVIFFAMLIGGCLPPTRPETPTTAAADPKTAEEKIAASLPLVEPGKVNETNARRIAQDLDDEIRREAKTPPKVVVEARK